MNQKSQIIRYYSNPFVMKKLLNFSKNREIAVKFGDFFSKRPQVIESLFDVKKFINGGATSFHCSEEIWTNPMLLKNQKEDEKIKNRIGWDLILDLDGIDFDITKFTTKKICDLFDTLEIKNYSVKFSGNKGFHIGICFEAFSNKRIGNEELRVDFPKVPKEITKYIISKISKDISKYILEKFSNDVKKISQNFNIEENELKIKDENFLNFNWLKIIEIDTILLASRHLYRMPYSLNEKSGLISIPIKKDEILNFDKKNASIENFEKNIKIYEKENNNFEFLSYDENFKKDANRLILEIENNLDLINEIDFENFILKQKKEKGLITSKNFEIDYSLFDEVSFDEFPKVIKDILDKKDFSDGKKRALFVLMSFFSSINYSYEKIEKLVIDWNSKIEDRLKDNYIYAQINWFKLQNKKITPPNYDNTNYYLNIGIDKKSVNEDLNFFKNKKIKNPLQYVYQLKLIKKFSKKKVNKNKDKK